MVAMRMAASRPPFSTACESMRLLPRPSCCFRIPTSASTRARAWALQGQGRALRLLKELSCPDDAPLLVPGPGLRPCRGKRGRCGG